MIRTAWSYSWLWLAETSAMQYAGFPGPIRRPPISMHIVIDDSPSSRALFGDRLITKFETEVDLLTIVPEICTRVRRKGSGTQIVDQILRPVHTPNIDLINGS